MLPLRNRLPTRSELRRLQRLGKRYSNELVSLIVVKRHDQLLPTRAAFVVGKRLDKRATRRNKTKRVLSMVVGMLLEKLEPGYDMLVYAKKILWEEKSPVVLEGVKRVLKEAGLLSS